MFKTTCKDCLFAIKQDEKQIGCQFNRLEKFDKEWSEQDQCWIINRLCTRCRHKSIANRYTNLMEDVIAESRVRVDAVIIFNKVNYKKLRELVFKLKSYKINSIVVCSNLKIDHNKLYNYCIDNQIRLVRGFSSREYLIDDAVKLCTGLYYATMKVTSNPGNFVEMINDIVENQCKTVSMIKDSEYIMYDRTLHKLLNGNFMEPLKKKIKRVLCKQPT